MTYSLIKIGQLMPHPVFLNRQPMIGKDWTHFIWGANDTSVGMTSRPYLQWRKSLPYQPTWSFIHCSQTKTRSIRPHCQTLTHTLYQLIRSSESAPRWQMVSGHRKNGDVPVVGHPPPGFTRSAATHTGVTATEALQLAEDRPFWRTIAMAGGCG